MPNPTEDDRKYLIEYSVAQFNATANYLNIVMAVGYAGFFAIWSLTKQYMCKTEMLLSGTLMAASLILFVLYEVFKVAMGSITAVSAYKSADSNDPAKLISYLKNSEENKRKWGVANSWIWFVSFGISIVTAFGAIGIILSAFIRSLLQ
ncbi:MULTISPECIES: hypothetical protein [unclassified Inquilinus]|uniref:hypothetical protein n=1 Tax=unclassified Inquilinus TaxID=2645927 RepID=UPI003F8E893A